MAMELPNLKALYDHPMLYVMTLGYILLLGSIVYLTNGRAEIMHKENTELARLLQNCIDNSKKR